MAYLRDYILATRYLRHSEKDYNDICHRIASAISTSPSQHSRFLSILSSCQFVPGGRTIACAGTDKQLIPNCVVLPVPDTLHDIFDTLRRAAVLQQAGCGLGFNFSYLRPAGYQCHRTGGSASGPISYMNLYSHAFKIVQQYNRSGANIAVLSIEHPDVVGFIHMKDDLSVMHNFNISVLITARFIEQLTTAPDTPWLCRFNGEDIAPRYITYDSDMLVTDISSLTITVRDIWNEIVTSAWKTGEPGLMFEHNMNVHNPLLDCFGVVNTVNPCGEISLYPNECCNLGSINLEQFCDVNPSYGSSADEAWRFVHADKLKECTRVAIEFMNNVVDKLDIPDRDLQMFVLLLRRLGLGVMALGDMLIKLKLPYNSDEGREVAERVFATINETAHQKSRELVSIYGTVADRLLDPVTYLRRNGFATLTEDDEGLRRVMSVMKDRDAVAKSEWLMTMANVACTCIAPTGSTSMILNVSSGIEPYFALAFRRSLKGELQQEVVMNKHLESWLKETGRWNDEVINAIIDGGIESVKTIPDEVKRVFVTSQKMSAEDHVMMQIVAQRHIDNSISKTCNFPNEATKEYVATIYRMAYEGGLKGITVYRDGCRNKQVFVSTERKDEEGTLVKDSCESGQCDA